mmetsp:Transcript_11394/g.26509  ORF Transcript_11394/g.26509 Transcript_11394/m.26509 type:complete len:218 (+) Transcript_11394:336-989(+)
MGRSISARLLCPLVRGRSPMWTGAPVEGGSWWVLSTVEALSAPCRRRWLATGLGAWTGRGREARRWAAPKEALNPTFFIGGSPAPSDDDDDESAGYVWGRMGERSMSSRLPEAARDAWLSLEISCASPGEMDRDMSSSLLPLSSDASSLAGRGADVRGRTAGAARGVWARRRGWRPAPAVSQGDSQLLWLLAGEGRRMESIVFAALVRPIPTAFLGV